MRIAINTLVVTPNKMGGKTFLTNLVKHLADIDQKNKYYLFVSELNKTIFEELLGENFKEVVFPLWSDNRYLRIFYEQMIIPFYIKKYKIDILLSPNNIATLFTMTKQLVVVQFYPLAYRFMLEKMSKFRRLYFSKILPLSVKKANKVIAVSKDIKRSLVSDINIKKSKVKVIYEGVDSKHFSNLISVKTKSLESQNPYILFLSTLFKHKNSDKLIRAFAKIKIENEISHDLILVGKDAENCREDLERLSRELGIENNVVFTGRVPFDKVGEYYKNADVFVYPSKVESFGLPILEAMACGTPVVASNRAAVPELVGGAGIIVDPDNIDELAGAILKVISDRSLRDSLIQKGYQRVKEFSWEKTARQTLELFEEVLNE